MRPIKFRAYSHSMQRMMPVMLLDTGFDGQPDNPIVVAEGTMLTQGDFELMQFTGMYDYDQQEIYEGDIVKLHLSREYGAKYDPSGLGFIGFDHSVDANIFGKASIWPSNGVMMTRIVTDDPDMFSDEHPVPKSWHVNRDCKVIGNIYENPELLEATK